MSYRVVNAVLAAAVANGGTFPVTYPSGTSRADYVFGTRHKIAALGALYEAPNDFTVALTNGTTATITWHKATTLPAGATVRVELDMAAVDDVKDWATQAGNKPAIPSYVHNSVSAHLRYIDLGSPVASNDAALRANAAIGAGGAIPLLAAGQKFDVPRNVIITSAGNDSGRTFVVTGTDEYGETVVENITGANIGVAAGVKAFKTIASISIDAAAAGNVKIGYGNVFGLPVWVPIASCIIAEYQDLAVPSNAATKVYGLAALTKSTATTADVRGTYAPNANAANVPDGTRAYSLLVALFDPQHIGNPQFAG